MSYCGSRMRGSAVWRRARECLPDLGMGALIALTVLLSFLPTFGNGFVNWDDDVILLENPRFRGAEAGSVSWVFADSEGSSKFVHWLPVVLGYRLWSADAAGYHALSLALHIGCALLLYVLCLLLTHSGPSPMPCSRGVRSRRWCCAAGALFYAVHPLRVETVAWFTELGGGLAGFFLLLSVVLYVVWCRRRSRRAGVSSARWILGSILAALLSLLAKPWAITLPAVLLTLDVYPLGRWREGAGPRRRLAVLLEKLPFAGLAILFVGLRLAARLSHAYHVVGVRQHGAVSRVVQACYGLCFYVWQTVVPTGLSPLYVCRFPLDPAEGRFVVSCVAVLVAVGLLARFAGRAPALSAAFVCYAAVLLPVLGLAQSGPQLAADRYTYIACMPFSVLVAAALLGLARGMERRTAGPMAWYGAVAVVALLLCSLSVLTFRQTRVWRDSETLWTHAVGIDPCSHFAYNHLGDALAARGDASAAREAFDAAIRLEPNYPLAYSNRAAVRRQLQDLGGALQDANMAIARASSLHPEASVFYTNRGCVFLALGDPQRALADLDRAVAARPVHSEAYYNRGVARHRLDDLRGAAADYTAALSLDTTRRDARLGRAGVLAALGDLTGALADYDRVLAADPGDAETYSRRGNVRVQLGDLEGALSDYGVAVELDPEDAAAYSNRGMVRKRLGDLDGALDDYNRAIGLGSAPAGAYVNRANVRRMRENLQGALDDYGAALTLEPRLVDAYVNRAGVFMQLGRRGAAEADYGSALRADPSSHKALAGRATLRMAEGDFDGARADYDRSIELDPGQASARVNRAVLLARVGDVVGAMVDLDAAVRLDPASSVARLNRGRLHLLNGAFADAVADLTAALESAPDDWAERAGAMRLLAQARTALVRR